MMLCMVGLALSLGAAGCSNASRLEQPAPRALELPARAALVEEPSQAQVRVMTVHKAKGLEFDVVVLPELRKKVGQVQGGTAADLPPEVRERIRAGADPAAPEVPLVVIAHSLGCHMISNYIWDVRDSKDAKAPPNPFEGFQTLAGIVMFGCNIPLFTLAYVNLQPIQFPTKNLKAYFPKTTPAKDIDEAAKWLNLYDPDDVLGYPLRPLSDAAALARAGGGGRPDRRAMMPAMALDPQAKALLNTSGSLIRWMAPPTLSTAFRATRFRLP